MSDTTTTNDAAPAAVDIDHTTAVARAEAAMAAAFEIAKSGTIRAVGVHPHHVMSYGFDVYRPSIRAGLQHLQTMRYSGVDPTILASLQASLVTTANKLTAVCQRVIDPATRVAELSRMHSAIPGACGSPFAEPPPPPPDGAVVPLPGHMHPSNTARETLRYWGYRGVRAERIGENITLAGPYNDSDVAAVRELKAHLLPLLPETVSL